MFIPEILKTNKELAYILEEQIIGQYDLDTLQLIINYMQDRHDNIKEQIEEEYYYWNNHKKGGNE